MCVCPAQEIHDTSSGEGDSGTVICHPLLYELPVVLAQNEFSLLSKVSKFIQREQIAIITIRGERVLDLFSTWIPPSCLPL